MEERPGSGVKAIKRDWSCSPDAPDVRSMSWAILRGCANYREPPGNAIIYGVARSGLGGRAGGVEGDRQRLLLWFGIQDCIPGQQGISRSVFAGGWLDDAEVMGDGLG